VKSGAGQWVSASIEGSCYQKVELARKKLRKTEVTFVTLPARFPRQDCASTIVHVVSEQSLQCAATSVGKPFSTVHALQTALRSWIESAQDGNAAQFVDIRARGVGMAFAIGDRLKPGATCHGKVRW
jgi:hypothetical protein